MTWSAVGFANTVPLLFVLAAVYGTSHGLVEGAEKALIAELERVKSQTEAESDRTLSDLRQRLRTWRAHEPGPHRFGVH